MLAWARIYNKTICADSGHNYNLLVFVFIYFFTAKTDEGNFFRDIKLFLKE